MKLLTNQLDWEVERFKIHSSYKVVGSPKTYPCLAIQSEVTSFPPNKRCVKFSFIYKEDFAEVGHENILEHMIGEING